MIKQFPITLNNKMMVISNGPNAGEYLESQTKNKFDFVDDIDDAPMGAYLDLQKIIMLANNSSKASFDKDSIVLENLKMWKNITVTGGSVKNNAVEMKAEIKLFGNCR